MYGTVARIRVKPGALEALKKLVQAEAEAGIEGYRGQTFFQMDKDPNEVYMAVLFELTARAILRMPTTRSKKPATRSSSGCWKANRSGTTERWCSAI